jgi:hypothetical protein
LKLRSGSQEMSEMKTSTIIAKVEANGAAGVVVVKLDYYQINELTSKGYKSVAVSGGKYEVSKI